MRAFSGGAGLAFEETLRLFFGGDLSTLFFGGLFLPTLFFGGGLPTLFLGGGLFLFFGGDLPTCSGLGVMGDYGRVMRMMTDVVIVLSTIMLKGVDRGDVLEG